MAETTRVTPLRLSGVSTRFEALQVRLAAGAGFDESLAAVRELHGVVEGVLAGAGRYTLAPAQAELRGWLAYFAEPESLARQLEARRAVTETLQRRSRARLPFVVQIRPLRGMLRVRGERRHTLVQLPSPAVALEAAGIDHCVDLVLRRPGARARLLESLLAPPCEAVRRRIAELGGAATQRAGHHHDLEAAFERINAEYFAGALARPTLAWSARANRRKLGHYDPLKDAVVLSALLDRPGVPPFVVEFVLYHELLHKHLGVDTGSGRVRVHTPAFRRAERRFRHYAEAEAALRAL